MPDYNAAMDARRRADEAKERKQAARERAAEIVHQTEIERAKIISAHDRAELVYRILKIMLPAVRKHMDAHSIERLRELTLGTDFDPKHLLHLDKQMDAEDRKDPQAGKIPR
jgi:uncharacterized ferritin-like protein (DUF455 family)